MYFLLNFQGFEPNKKRKPRKEEHFYQNKVLKTKNEKPKKSQEKQKKENTGLFFLNRFFPTLPLFVEKKPLKISDHSTFYDHKSPVPYI